MTPPRHHRKYKTHRRWHRKLRGGAVDGRTRAARRWYTAYFNFLDRMPEPPTFLNETYVQIATNFMIELEDLADAGVNGKRVHATTRGLNHFLARIGLGPRTREDAMRSRGHQPLPPDSDRFPRQREDDRDE